MGTIPWDDQPVSWWWIAPSCSRQPFVLAELGTYPGNGFSSAHKAPASTTIGRLTEVPVHSGGILHSIASDQGTHSAAQEVGLWAHDARGIHGSCHVPSLPKQLARWSGGMAF